MDCEEQQATLDQCSTIAQRLRQCLRFDKPTPVESEIEHTARESADAIDMLVAHIKLLDKWRQEGEKLFDPKGTGILFSIGAWWADRPWRK